MEDSSSIDTLLPLKPADFQILLVLLDGDRHGYGIMKEVERLSGGKVRLEIGSLYRIVGRLLENGVIADAPTRGDATDARRRRHYRITPFGRRVATAEAERLTEVLDAARTRRLLATKPLARDKRA